MFIQTEGISFSYQPTWTDFSALECTASIKATFRFENGEVLETKFSRSCANIHKWVPFPTTFQWVKKAH